jgi:hypothetical protein
MCFEELQRVDSFDDCMQEIGDVSSMYQVELIVSNCMKRIGSSEKMERLRGFERLYYHFMWAINIGKKESKGFCF